MRALHAGWAALFVVSLLTTTPILAAAAPAPASSAASVSLRWPSSGALDIQSTERDKKKTAKKKETIAIRVPSSAKRGDKDVEIIGKPSSEGRTCEMTIKWNDGKSTDVEKVRANDSKQCIFKVEVPRGDKVIGEASVAMKVTDGHGKKLASASRILHVE